MEKRGKEVRRRVRKSGRKKRSGENEKRSKREEGKQVEKKQKPRNYNYHASLHRKHVDINFAATLIGYKKNKDIYCTIHEMTPPRRSKDAQKKKHQHQQQSPSS